MTALSAGTPGNQTIWTFIRRRWPWAAALVALLVLLAAIIAWRGGGIFGGDGTTPSLRDVLNPLSLFDERSPGDRADGSLLAAKRGKGGRVNPVELVMSTGRQRAPPVSEAVAPAAPESLFAAPAGGPFAASDVPESGLPGDAILGSPEGPPAGLGNPGFIIPIGTVPGVSGPPTTPPGTPPCCVGPPGGPGPIPPPIPEPATWLMMILGFFTVGAALRAQPRAALAIARSGPGRE